MQTAFGTGQRVTKKTKQVRKKTLFSCFTTFLLFLFTLLHVYMRVCGCLCVSVCDVSELLMGIRVSKAELECNVLMFENLENENKRKEIF